MDERYRKWVIWVGLGALAILFLCVMLCGLGAMAMLVTDRSLVYVQPPTGEDGAPPPLPYYGHGPVAMGRTAVFGGIGVIFRLLIFGMLLLLLFGLVKRIFWGHRYWRGPHWGGPPPGQDWKGKGHPGWGPWAWHGHWRCWEPGAEQAPEEDEPGSAGPAYAGPKE